MKSKLTLGVVVQGNLDLARDILLGIRSYCNANRNVHLELLSASGFVPKLASLEVSLDALIAFESLPESIEVLHKLTPNVVLTSNRFAMEAPKVINDDFEIGRMGARYLLSKGYPSLAFLHAEGCLFSKERRQGFLEITEKSDIETRVLDLNNLTKVPDALKILETLPSPVGILGCSDLHARWLIESLEDPTKDIPSRFAILGVDNDTLEQALCPVPLSSIALAGRQIGYAAAETATQWARGSRPPDEPVRIRPRGIITRHSTDMLAYTDPIVKKALTLISEKTEQFRDVGDVVRVLGIPRRTLEYRFNKVTGNSLGTLLTQARIRKASNLLAQTDLSIKEIAYLVGLSEPRMLSLIFKRETHETPSEYRERTKLV
ncbi:MAG: helix-turn-helix domain-containing protein [Verrucomicrobia bacterium]|nr:helix-turn-helix domain-containing protein [Verrucomicrobiota bacterium]MCH8513738.1 helix-turn-helix domain-containing protein [Kiritimatiellia bacterium]